MADGIAILSSSGDFSSFTYGPTTIRFRTPSSLERWLRVKDWDGGYLVADVQYRDEDGPTEDYLDLRPILRNLYFEPESFLRPIKEVRIEY